MILLDTHVVLWWQEGGRRLSSAASKEIARADVLVVSPISFWEIATLVRKNRVSLDRNPFQWAMDFLSEDSVELAPMSAQVGIQAGLLDPEIFTGDPADRILYATAKELVVPLITKDQNIRRYAAETRDVKTVW